MRAENRRAACEDADPLSAEVSVSGVDDDVAPDDRLAWARETLARLDVLPHEQLQALRLVYRDGLLLSEAAERLNVSLSEFARNVAAGLRALGTPTPAVG